MCQIHLILLMFLLYYPNAPSHFTIDKIANKFAVSTLETLKTLNVFSTSKIPFSKNSRSVGASMLPRCYLDEVSIHWGNALVGILAGIGWESGARLYRVTA